MNYEKKYKEALERMKSWAKGEHPECFSEAQKTAEFIFPELKESEEERIKKALIKILNEIVINTNYKELGIDYNIRDMIAWLEKQGEKKPTDKAKPKFKVGDKVTIEGDDTIYTICSIDLESCWLTHEGRGRGWAKLDSLKHYVEYKD